MQFQKAASDALSYLVLHCKKNPELKNLMSHRHFLKPIFAWRSNLRVVTEVAKSLEFSPRLWALADKVIRGMTDNGRNEYNAVHLRIEKDARDWSAIMGGQEVLLHPPSQLAAENLSQASIAKYLSLPCRW